VRAHRWLLDSLVRCFPDGSIGVFDRDLRCVHAAGAGFDPIGLSSTVLMGQRLDDLFPAASLAPVKPFYARAFAGELVTFALVVFGLEYTVRAAPLAEPDGTARAIAALTREAPVRPGVEMLPPRLREIAALIAAGLTNEQIAERLCVESGSVRYSVWRIAQRLGCTSRTQIGSWALACGLYRLGEDDAGKDSS